MGAVWCCVSYVFFFFKQKTAYEMPKWLEFRRVLFRSISAEDTFEQDVLLPETEPMIRRLAEHAWAASRNESRIARTVVLKLKTSEFKILTRSHKIGRASCRERVQRSMVVASWEVKHRK